MKLQYNFLNLVAEVGDQNNIPKARYTYLADGTKIGVKDRLSRNGFEYYGSFRYAVVNGVTKFESVPYEGGRIIVSVAGSGASAACTYSINAYTTDHLNSVRGAKYNAFDSAFEDYYPFGKGWENPAYSSNFDKYTYNGKEMQTTGWLPYLDYGARMYDPRIGRWFGPDPLAEKYYSTSPYAFCANNPINRIDLDGMDSWYTNDPIEIQNFLTHMATRPLSEYDLSGWSHTTDEELAGAEVVYNDATNTAYYKWGSMVNGVPTANAMIFPGIRESSANMGNLISSWVGPTASFGGIMAGIGAEVAFSKAFNTWLGRDKKIRSQNWGGNKYTGGKQAFAAKNAKYFKWAGSIFSAINQGALLNSFLQGEMPTERFLIETASNGIGLIPLYGTAWSIGWEAGRYTGKWLNDN